MNEFTPEEICLLIDGQVYLRSELGYSASHCGKKRQIELEHRIELSKTLTNKLLEMLEE